MSCSSVVLNNVAINCMCVCVWGGGGGGGEGGMGRKYVRLALLTDFSFGLSPTTGQGLVVQNPIKVNPRLKDNRGFSALVKNIFKV